jgi:hypothetical protein
MQADLQESINQCIDMADGPNNARETAKTYVELEHRREGKESFINATDHANRVMVYFMVMGFEFTQELYELTEAAIALYFQTEYVDFYDAKSKK